MTELLINEATLFHNILLEEVNKNQIRVVEIEGLAKKLTSILSNFSQSLSFECRQLFQKLKVDEDEDQGIVFLSKFIIDLLNELAKKLMLITKKINNQVTLPLNQFLGSQSESKKKLLSRSADMLSCLEVNSTFLNELNKNFNLNNSLELNENQKQEIKLIYESEMEKCNEKWLQIKKGYKQLLADADSANSFRVSFCIKMKAKIAKVLNKVVNSPNVDDSINCYEELCEQNEALSFAIKEKIREKMGKTILLQNNAMEEFDGNFNFAFQDKKIIDDFISYFTSFSLMKEDEKKHEKARSLILDNPHWGSYFLNRMRSNLHTEIKLPAMKFHQIITIIKYLFASCVEEHNNQLTIYNLLYISYRLNCNGVYIMKEIGKHENFWQRVEIWQRLINYIRGVKEESNEGKNASKNKQIRKMFKDSLLWIRFGNNRIYTEKKIKSQKIIQQRGVYEIVCEINYFLARLELKEKNIFDIIVKLSTIYHFSIENTKKLLKFHYLNKHTTIDKMGSTVMKRKKKLQEKYQAIPKSRMIVICVGKCLKYLNVKPSQLVQLRLVNTTWAKHLKNKILKRYLLYQKNYTYVNKIRIHLYNAYPPAIIGRQVFNRMLSERPEFIEHAEIIQLDVKRSLSWDESLRQSLVNILEAFSFYNPNVGYLQGMNYLCENIIKLTDDQFIIYRIFQYLMNNQFYGMYTANFDGLRTKIYQFMRIIEREKPKLYTHFQTEKLQGEHFLLPWAITLWGEMSGDLCWVMWDGFLCKGWKWWMKVGLWLLGILEPELMKMNFEGMMKCFSELSTGLLSMNAKQLKDFGIDIVKVKGQIDSIRLQNSILTEIEKEYKLKESMLNDYLKKIGIIKKNR